MSGSAISPISSSCYAQAMAYKEKPLIDAGSKGAGVPDFFFSNPFWAGFFGMAIAALLGGVCFGVPGALFAGGNNRALAGAISVGSIVAMIIALVANIYFLSSAGDDAHSVGDRGQTLAGAVVACAIFLAALWFGAPYMFALLELMSSSAIRPTTPVN